MNYDYDFNQGRSQPVSPIALTADWRDIGQQLVFMAGIFALVFLVLNQL